MLADAGTSRESLPHELRPELVDALSDALAQQGRVFVAEAGAIRLKREQIAAVLPLTLALRDLRPRQPGGARGLRDRLAVLAAYAGGRAGATAGYFIGWAIILRQRRLIVRMQGRRHREPVLQQEQ
jgi:hypothetical protein